MKKVLVLLCITIIAAPIAAQQGSCAITDEWDPKAGKCVPKKLFK